MMKPSSIVYFHDIMCYIGIVITYDDVIYFKIKQIVRIHTNFYIDTIAAFF